MTMSFVPDTDKNTVQLVGPTTVYYYLQKYESRLDPPGWRDCLNWGKFFDLDDAVLEARSRAVDENSYIRVQISA